jgi:hypothetical protein
MNNNDKKNLAGRDGAKEFTLKIFGDEQKHTLPENMTIEEFKSFILTLTENKPFNL